MKEQVTVAIFTEIFRLELATAEAELNQRFTDGGRKSGDRQKKIAQAAAEAMAETIAAMQTLKL